MHQRASVDVVTTCKPAAARIFMCFLSPSFACEILEGGSCKTIIFYSSRSHPPRNSIAAVGFRFWVSSKTRGKSSQRSCAVCFLIYVYPTDISRLKSGIRSNPPTSFGSPKNTWGVDISRGQVKYFSEISCLTPPKYSKVKGGVL